MQDYCPKPTTVILRYKILTLISKITSIITTYYQYGYKIELISETQNIGFNAIKRIVETVLYLENVITI